MLKKLNTIQFVLTGMKYRADYNQESVCLVPNIFKRDLTIYINTQVYIHIQHIYIHNVARIHRRTVKKRSSQPG